MLQNKHLPHYLSILLSAATVFASTPQFEPQTIGGPLEDTPWITDLAIADLDQDGHLDVLYCEGLKHQVGWLKGDEKGGFNDSVLQTNIAGAAHVEAVDIDHDGDLDLLVASMGVVFPNPNLIGKVIVLENDGRQQFTPRIIEDGTYRVTDIQAADIDADGDLDLAVAKFGYEEGEVCWLRNEGDWKFEYVPLLDLSGGIHCPIADIDADGDLDIITLISQEWEEIYVIRNENGTLTPEVVFGSTNEDYGSSGISLADLDQDGDLDILYTNGDGFDYAMPGPRPWHGLQWLENDGKGKFKFHRVGDFQGAYSPIALDVEGDGDIDILATSCFADWTNPESVSLMLFENQGDMSFKATPLANRPTHLVVIEAADFDKDGRHELVTGGFNAYPPFDHISRITLWQSQPPASKK